MAFFPNRIIFLLFLFWNTPKPFLDNILIFTNSLKLSNLKVDNMEEYRSFVLANQNQNCKTKKVTLKEVLL